MTWSKLANFSRQSGRVFLWVTLAALLMVALLTIRILQPPDSDYDRIEEITIDNSAETTTFRIPSGFTPYEYVEPHIMRVGSSIIVDLWWDGVELKPYWPKLKELKAANTPPEIFYPLQHRSKIQVEISAQVEGGLKEMKDRTVLPNEIDRDFPVFFDGLYWLGNSTAGDRQNTGRRFYRFEEQGVQEIKSVDHWYVPADEDEFLGFYAQCTNHPKTPDDGGQCTIHRELTDASYIRYHFFKGHLFEWQHLDQQVSDLILSFLATEDSSTN